MRKIALGFGVAVALAAHAAPEPPVTTPTAAEIASLEHARDKRPADAERRGALALAYYRYARAAFDRHELPAYEDYLARAIEEWVEMLRIDPENPEPHVYMGIASAYQGRIEETLESLQNARVLEPRSPVAYTNIAETLIYMGRDAREVETWLSRGERMGANPAIVELNFCLLRWRDGDAASAARRFNTAAKLDPSVVEVWNEAPVSKPIDGPCQPISTMMFCPLSPWPCCSTVFSITRASLFVSGGCSTSGNSLKGSTFRRSQRGRWA
jgi:tetratricopeptide (TPR) repeat protein